MEEAPMPLGMGISSLQYWPVSIAYRRNYYSEQDIISASQKMTLQYDPEFAEALGQMMAGVPTDIAKPPLHDVEGRRAQMLAAFAGADFEPVPMHSDVEQTIYHVKSADGFDVPVYRFSLKKAASTPGPAILHVHGGGFIHMSVEVSANELASQVAKTGVPIFSVDYRLAPEAKFPKPFEDCWAALKWVHDNAGDLSIDLKRIGLMGESAGGGLAAALGLCARDKALQPPISKLILIYPMLDDRTTTDHTGGLALWDDQDNITAWTAYIGEQAGKTGVSPYAAPARASDLSGLPPVYIECGQLDIFVHEDVEFVRRLVAANIPTEFHLIPGVPHGFEGPAPLSSITKRAVENRVRAMLSI